MNKYEGLHCPVCHGKMFEDDDIVVCPVCGAPHHRDCYKRNNRCSFADKHGTEEQWQRPEPVTSAEEPPVVCYNCGKQLSSDSRFCDNCRAPVFSQANPQSPPPYTPFIIDPMGGVHADDSIDGVSAKEIASYVLINTGRYLPRFRSISAPEKKKTSWNFAAFFLAPYWLFYRKCYKEAMLSLLVFASYLALRIPFAMSLSSFVYTNTRMNSIEMTSRLVNDMIQTNQGWRLGLLLLSVAIQIGLSVYLGLFGDYIYKKNAVSKIKELKGNAANVAGDFLVILQRSGGVNVIIPVMLFCLELFLNIL